MPPGKKIRVLLADDHTVLRQALSSFIETAGDFSVVGQADSGAAAIELVAALQPDVILLDVAMPHLDGAEATRRILAANPKARVLILSAHSDNDSVGRLIAAGAAGFLEKQTGADLLTQGIREVAAGRTFFSPAIARRLAEIIPRARPAAFDPRTDRLTPREKEVLRLIAQGQANKHVADLLQISIKTVQKHRQHLMDKLDIHETAGLTRYAIMLGLL